LSVMNGAGGAEADPGIVLSKIFHAAEGISTGMSSEKHKAIKFWR